MFYVYILESIATGQWYYGSTNRLEERLKEHNGDHHHFTGRKGPWVLIFVRSFPDRRSALSFEKKLKKLRNKDFIRNEFGEYFLTR